MKSRVVYVFYGENNYFIGLGKLRWDRKIGYGTAYHIT